MANIRDLRSGKMYAGLSPPTKERISRPSSKVSARSKDVKLMRLDLRNGTTREKFWEMISQSHGGYLTLNTGESHRDENASILSQILMTDVRCAGKILFESEGLSGYSAESFRSWQAAARSITQGSGASGIGVDGYNGAVSDKAATLGINCGMSTGRNGAIVLNDQGMDVTEEKTCTLRAESHHPPVVMESAGFCTEHSAKSRSIGYEKEKSPTLRAGVVPAAVYENHSMDTRYRELGDVAPTVSATYGMGGNNQPFVVEKTYDVRFTSEGTKNARQNVYETDTARTVDTGGIPPDANQGGIAVVEAYGICSKDSNAMKSDNPNSGFYKAETSRTIDGNGGNPSCNQGGIAVVAIEGNGTRPSHHGNGYSEEGVGYTLNTTEQHGVAYGIGETRTHNTLFPFRKR